MNSSAPSARNRTIRPAASRAPFRGALAAALLLLGPWAPAQQDAGAAPKVDAPAAAPEAAPKTEAPPAPKPRSSESARAETPSAETEGAAALSPEQRLKAEWAYLRQAGEDTTNGVPAAAAEDIAAMLEHHPDAPGMDDAQAFLAWLYRKQGDSKAALVAYLHLLYAYPDSQAARTSKSDINQVGDKVLSSKLKAGLAELTRGTEGGDKADRLALMLQRIVNGLGAALYEPTVAEFHRFQGRFPDYPKSDAVQLELAQLHEKGEKYPAAILEYRKLLAKFPDSAACSSSQFALAGLYAEDLRDYQKAVDTYQDLVQKYPKSPEVLPSLQRASQLYSERLRKYELAVRTDEKIVRDFPKTDGALKAFNDEAKLLRDRLSEPEEAIKAYRSLVEQFKDQTRSSVDALENAATIARKDMKDYKTEVDLRTKIATDYAQDKDAAEQLFTVAEVYEKDLHDVANAIRTYKLVSSNYMGTKYGDKARDKVQKLQ